MKEGKDKCHYAGNPNYHRAIEYFKESGEWFEGCVMHHIDESLKHTNVERYNEWRPEDLMILSRAEHNSLHFKGRTPWNKGKKTGPPDENTKCKIGDANRGENNGMYGKDP